MPDLEQLPNEILAKIISFLPTEDILITSGLSRHVRAISQPLLYKASNLPFSEEQIPTPLQQFLRTLLSLGGETLAAYVRSFSIMCSGDIDEPDSDDEPTPVSINEPTAANDIEEPDSDEEPTPDTLKDLALLVAAATPLQLHQYLKYEDGQLLLLLHLLPRLQVLHLSHASDPSFFEFMDPHNAAWPTDALPPGLRHLREFSCWTGDNCGVSPANLLTVLSLPCIRKIHTRVLNASSISLDTARLAVATSTVTTLLLAEADNSQLFLECILKIPTALTHFGYSTTPAHPEFHLRVALQPLRASLIDLHLECEGVALQIGSLRDWPALRTLRCSLTVLLGEGLRDDTISLADLLPAGLLELEIIRDRHWPVAVEVGREVELLRQKETAVPALVTLAVVISGINMTRDVRHQTTLRHACKDAGVALVDIGSRGRELAPYRWWRGMSVRTYDRPVRSRRL